MSYPELKLIDTAFQRPSRLNHDIIVIGTDDYALEYFGRYQGWHQSIFAEAINILNSDPEAKPA